jgi:transmembrane sensor
MSTPDQTRRLRAARDAARWLARIESGSIDEAAFERWRDADVTHQIAFARALAVWTQAVEETVEAPPIRRVDRRMALRAMAAGAACLIVAGGGLTTKAYAWESASSRIGERKPIILPDGSRAMLNTDSKVSWRFSGSERRLWLDRGEIALDLVPGSPIALEGMGEMAGLTAGRFNVRLQAHALDVTVFRGEAVAERRGVQSPARDNQRLLLSAARPSIQPSSASAIIAATAWQQGEIIFDNEPLSAAVQEYNRYLYRKIVIADPLLTHIPIGGRFTSNDPASFLHALKLSLDIQATVSDDQILLTK